jgi:hypothetical protein
VQDLQSGLRSGPRVRRLQQRSAPRSRPPRENGAPASREHPLGAWLLSLYGIFVWLLLSTGSVAPFYVGVILLLLPIARRCVHLALAHVLHAGAAKLDAAPSLTRSLLNVPPRHAPHGRCKLIAWLLGLGLAAMTNARYRGDAAAAGAINAVVIVLLADSAGTWRALGLTAAFAAASAGGETKAAKARAAGRSGAGAEHHRDAEDAGGRQFGDFAIEIRLKLMTKPGEQFVIRRRAYALIKKAFRRDGIEFAFPTLAMLHSPSTSLSAMTRRAASRRSVNAAQPQKVAGRLPLASIVTALCSVGTHEAAAR